MAIMGHDGQRSLLSSRHTSGDAPATRREGVGHRGRRPPSSPILGRPTRRRTIALRPVTHVVTRPAGVWFPVSRSQPKGGEPHDWVTRAADDAIRHHEKTGAEDPVTGSSGASPSGRVHLGNLREFLMPHFVADELRRRGVPVRHLHVWDDYDRFRKVPAGVDPSWSEHIGRPLSAVPDPWECHDSWAEHFKATLRAALAELGVEMEEVSQTEQYRAGAYTEQVLHAIRHRDVIEEVLARHRTKKAEPAPENEQEAEALADSVADDEDDQPSGAGNLARFPYKPYCRQCGRDTVVVTAYDDETTDLSYTCTSCGFTGVTNVAT